MLRRLNKTSLINQTMNSNPHCPGRPATGKEYCQTKNPAAAGPALLLAALACLLAVRVAAQGVEQNFWTGAGSDINWSTSGNWNGGAPVTESDVFFTPTGASPNTFVAGGGTANNQVDTSITLNSLWCQPTNAWQITEIPLGNTLTINGSQSSTNLDLVSLGTDFYALYVGSQINKTMSYTIEGPGTLNVNSPGAMVMVRNSYNGVISTYPTLDLSALSTFNASVIGVCVGGEGTTTATFNDRPIGILYMAQTNVISSTNTVMLRAASLTGLILTVGDCIVSTGNPSYVYMGNSNAFLGAVGIGVGWRRGQGNLLFNPTNSGGVAYFRGAGGVGPQSYWGIGDNYTGNTGFTSTGKADFTGGTVDAMVTTIYVGRSGTSTTSTANGTGTLLISNGLITAGSLFIGTQRTGNNVGWGNGTVTTSGGPGLTNLIVTGNLTMGSVISGTGINSTAGTLNVGSSVVVNGSIIGGGAGGALSTTINLNGGALSVGGSLGQSTSAINTLNLNSGTLNLSLGSGGNSVTPICNASNLNIGSVTLNLTGGAGASPGIIPIMSYYNSGGFAGITYGALPSTVYGYYSNSATTLYLVVTNVSEAKWNGNVNGNWDTTTANWIDTISHSSTTYQQGEPTLFDDSATGTTTVNLTTVLTPAGITVNNTKPYAFGGAGAISGATALTKTGSGVLTLTNSGTNTFTGGVAINGGELQLGGAGNVLPTSAVVTLAAASGVTLDLNGENQLLGGLAGGGTNGGDVTLESASLILAGNGSEFDGVISGAGTVVLTNGVETLGGANVYTGGTTLYGGTLTAVNSSGSAIGTGPLTIAGGTFQLGNASTTGLIPQTIITNNGTFSINHSDDFTLGIQLVGSGGLTKLALNTLTILETNSYTGPTTITDGALSIGSAVALGNTTNLLTISGSQLGRIELNGNTTLANPILLISKGGAFNAPPHVESVTGTNFVTGLVSGTTGGSDWVFQSDDGDLIVTSNFTNTTPSANVNLDLRGNALGEWRGNIGGGSSPSFQTSLVKLDPGTWILDGTNTFTGSVSLDSGTLVVNGKLLATSGVNITFGTLSGSGLIAGPVAAGFPGTIWPGNGGFATLTISNTLSFNSAATAEFDLSQNANDKIAGLSTVNYNGELLVNQIGNLYANAVFKLFDAANYTGTFNDISLPSLMAPLTWDTSYLAVDGALRITGGPSILSLGLNASGQFQMAGTGTAGNTYQILATTNLSLPLASWTQVATGTFAGDGSFSFFDPNTKTNRQQFYEVVSP